MKGKVFLAALACAAALLAGCRETTGTNDKVLARQVPERADDFVWENDLICYRVYGEALETTLDKLVSPGFDVWVKNVPELVADRRYKDELENGRTYHKDWGDGKDCYKVAVSLGGGASAPLVDGKLCFPATNYRSWKILEKTPEKVVFVLEYPEWDAGGVMVSLQKKFTVTAGTRFCRVDDIYSFSGDGTLDIAAGIVRHNVLEENVGKGMFAIWEEASDQKAEPEDGKIGLGLIMPGAREYIEAEGHSLLVAPVRSGQGLTYYFGSCWSKAPLSCEEWFKSVEEYANSYPARLPDTNYDEDKVPEYVLPDVLTMNNGSRVKDKNAWEKKRRGEVLEMFKDQMFGRAPEELPEGIHYETVEEGPASFDPAVTRRQVKIYLDREESQCINLLLYMPASDGGPVPAFLGINFKGNHATTDDPAVIVQDYSRYGDKVPQAERAEAASRWPMEYITSHGYAVATFRTADVDPDFDDGFLNGVHSLYPGERSGDSWATIAAWAWGLSRVLDYLETDKDIDAGRVAVIGHSRLGKTALWAGATDPRFAMVVSNCSGCGGAALSRRHFGETIARINTGFPHWFCDNFKAYNENEAGLPFDQHELLALIAPRPLYVASATEDRWADPDGEYLSLKAAGDVYALYGFETLTDPVPPEPEHPVIAGRNGYHRRIGSHDILLYDWSRYIDFADQFLK